jgi:hypothetical protein
MKSQVNTSFKLGSLGMKEIRFRNGDLNTALPEESEYFLALSKNVILYLYSRHLLVLHTQHIRVSLVFLPVPSHQYSALKQDIRETLGHMIPINR